jgi:hypothetical protein
MTLSLVSARYKGGFDVLLNWPEHRVRHIFGQHEMVAPHHFCDLVLGCRMGCAGDRLAAT